VDKGSSELYEEITGALVFPTSAKTLERRKGDGRNKNLSLPGLSGQSIFRKGMAYKQFG
jgi:hypothetical protein